MDRVAEGPGQAQSQAESTFGEAAKKGLIDNVRIYDRVVRP